MISLNTLTHTEIKDFLLNKKKNIIFLMIGLIKGRKYISKKWLVHIIKKERMKVCEKYSSYMFGVENIY